MRGTYKVHGYYTKDGDYYDSDETEFMDLVDDVANLDNVTTGQCPV